MLRGNLATRPFYNDRVVTAALALVACAAVALTAFNGWKLATLSKERRDVQARVDRADREASRVRAEAAGLERGLDRAALTRLADATSEANTLIDERMFSWTAFFALIEKTLPIDMRVLTVSPSLEKGVFKVSMTVVARDFHDVDKFIDALEGTGAFYDVVPAEQQLRDDGTYGVTIVAAYLSPTGPPMRRTATGTTGGRP